jgi:pyruvate/2-oxoglutarate dehydrogenase complex dihydrolipoamide acyltransferase (E2) component
MMAGRRFQLVLPDLGLGNADVQVSVWLAALGSEVVCGDRILEVVSADVAVDLPAPATGRLVQRCVAVDEVLHAGQLLGVIEETEDGEI